MTSTFDNLTILSYTSNAMPEKSHRNFQLELLKVIGDTPLISVSQKPMDFGTNICVGEIGQSYYNLYKQMYIGLQEVKTPWVAMAEDDTLYTLEHFEYRPSSDKVIAYNSSMWFLDNQFWTKQGHTGTFGCIAPTAYLLDILEQRYTRFPEEILPRHSQKWLWLDPGQDHRLGFADANTETFQTTVPLITYAYFGATSGKPKPRKRTATFAEELPYWGKATELRQTL